MSDSPRSRSFLKWPGGKYRLLDRIQKKLPQSNYLVEPFVGSGVVFLNIEFEHYFLNDINPDLIQLYQCISENHLDFIEYCESFFKSKYNKPKHYYQFREDFNHTNDSYYKSALFLYLNRHGYNGLIRYNQKARHFNVPFGSYKKPYFPKKEMLHFHQKSPRTTFSCQDFAAFMKKAPKDSVIYCDPPYVPYSKTASFTQYHGNEFCINKQKKLAAVAEKLANQGIPVLLSNHANQTTRQLYSNALIESFSVQRYISCQTQHRKAVRELLALFY